jgi:hypothetical protein
VVLPQSLGNPHESTIATACLISGGLPKRHPRLLLAGNAEAFLRPMHSDDLTNLLSPLALQASSDDTFETALRSLGFKQ